MLSRFEDVGLINDAAFADAWVESRHHGRGLARRALARELRTKGVDSALIDEAVGQLDSEQEERTARELVARKLRSTRGLDRDERLRRLAGMLARKGYPEGLALRVVRRALEEEGEDTELLERRSCPTPDAFGPQGPALRYGGPRPYRAVRPLGATRGPPARDPRAGSYSAPADRPPASLEAADEVGRPVQAQLAQRDRREAGGVALVADHHDPQIVAGRLGQPVVALRVEPPLQLVALHDQRARDGAVALPQRRVADVHQQPARGCTAAASSGPIRSSPWRASSSSSSTLRFAVSPRAPRSLPVLLRLLDLLQPQHLAGAAVAPHQRQRRVVGVHRDRMLAPTTG